jgi:hypothetical protein
LDGELVFGEPVEMVEAGIFVAFAFRVPKNGKFQRPHTTPRCPDQAVFHLQFASGENLHGTARTGWIHQANQ